MHQPYWIPFSIARTRDLVDIGKMPTSCADLERTGHKLSGFFSVKGSKKMEIVYCDFYPNKNGTASFRFTAFFLLSNSLICRFTKMDRIRRRQIGARPFLRHEKFYIFRTRNSGPVRFGAGERGKCHGFDNGNFHGTSTGNLFFLFHGSGVS
jgi:hypothetical protein